jgi:hypothetical protein
MRVVRSLRVLRSTHAGWDELKLSCEFKSNVGLSILFNDDITERCVSVLFRVSPR